MYLQKSELEDLMEAEEKIYVSLFMPTHRLGKEVQQNPIRLKNLLSKAEDQLVKSGLKEVEARKLLDEAEKQLTDDLFWQHQSDGLAIFMAPCLYKQYRLPLNFEPLVVTSDAFHLKPLLPLYSSDSRFYLLALSQNEVRFMQGTQQGLDEITLPDCPESMAEVLRFDDPEKQLQYHSTDTPGSQTTSPVYHGHGVGQDNSGENLKRFVRAVARSVEAFLNQDDTPLILAGVTSILSAYRAVNGYAYLVKEQISGNPESLAEENLHQQAWAIMEPYFLKAQREAIAKFEQLAKTDRASSDIEQIIPAAFQGRIETLIVSLDVQQWGTFDPNTYTLNLHTEAQPGDRDLLDIAAVQTHLNGGRVFAVPAEKLPGKTPIAALFRYW